MAFEITGKSVEAFLSNPIVAVVVVAAVVGFVVVALVMRHYKGQGKAVVFKPISIMDVAKHERNELTRHAAPYGFKKTLKCGPENYGRIKTLSYVKVSSIGDASLRTLLKRRGPAVFTGYETTSDNWLIHALGLGKNYYLVESPKILNEDTAHVYINPYSQRDNFLGFNVFSPLGEAVVENLIYKEIHKQHLEGMINFVPKSTILEFDRAKDKAAMLDLGELTRGKNRELMEQIRKGKA
jgi:hypothetical protein